MSLTSHNPASPPQVMAGKSRLGFLAFVLLCFFAASSAPTPLYPLYQQAWGFSPGMLALIFAVYAFSLLAALLSFGALSDYLGRRPVIFAALLVQVVAMLLFIFASNPAWLIGARLLQGFATGMAASALGAAMLDGDPVFGALVNSIAPMFGMAAGALGTALLVIQAPWPLLLPYAVLLACFVFQAGYLWRLPESAARRPGALASLRPSLHVPLQARAMFWRVLPVDIAAWALGGFFLSLSPSLLAAATGSHSPLNGGLAVATLTLSGAMSILVMRRREPVQGLWAGAAFLPVGVIVILLAVQGGSLGVFLFGTLIAGIGFGAGFLGALRLLVPLARPEERAGLMSTFYVVSYLAFCLPALAAGFASRTFGLIVTSKVYGSLVILLALLALACLLRQRAGTVAVQRNT